ncbi:MAG: putative bifunctional diguanylate cyclase/phosphodiesterase [Beijerinckiaceae bacterium]
MLAQRSGEQDGEAAQRRPQEFSKIELDAQAILNSIGDLTYEWDLSQDRLTYGPNAGEVLGFPDLQEISSGRAFARHVSAESASTRYEAVVATRELDTGQGVPYQIAYGLQAPRVSARAGMPLMWIEDTGRWFAGPDGRAARAHGVMRVVTERYETERQRSYHSQFDALTGALHRARFIEHASKRLAECLRKGGTFAVMLCGLDNLFAFNRTYGYDVGDELIAAVGVRIRAEIRSTDLLARYAGNKFALYFEAFDADEMEAAARRILATIEETPFLTTGGQISADLHIGGVLAPEQGRMIQAVLRHAEEALESARRALGDRYVAYAPNLVREDARMHCLQVSDEIISALNQGRVVLALQPIVAAKTQEIAFYEALLRLDNDEGRLIMPSAILPVAEKTGLIQLIDQRVLELATAQLVQDPTLQLSLNVSSVSLLGVQWLERLLAICRHNPDVARRLTVEITETCAISDVDATRRAIAAMKACSVKVAMDDFGAGHTSFRNLRSLDVDLLKIDGAFVQNLSRCADDRAFVRTLVDLARHLGIPTVAECVEDAETAAILAEWGVDYLQGHHFGAAQIATRPSR